ncbi:hypothetical protein POTOM_018343 [Populus tomentosa]|uniref:Uncharacterized protein n=1 Tax=Populus tomentosa TaxID=118781 RepID=A0A8X8A5J4_POPTO|nr:hypothetical protein POTOM_018343 [Populus tomentosa]
MLRGEWLEPIELWLPVPWEGASFEVLSSKLRKLNVLDLSHNLFTDDTILSCLAGLSSLKSLDLRYNYILTGSGFEVLSSRLKKLENLDLSGNSYIDSIFSSLTGLSSLKFLDLSDNELTGSAGFYGLRKLEALSLNELTIIGSTLLQSLGALPSLKTLSLRANNLSGTSISQVPFFNLTTLEELYLDRTALPVNFLQNIIPLPALKILSASGCDLHDTQGWGELKNLEQLDLSRNNLEGSLPDSLDGLKNLEQLDLSGNNLKGLLPDCLRNLSSLQLLDVSGNQFTGNIASGPLTNLISLKFLSLSNNHFEVPLSFKSFSNHSKLKFFMCDNITLVEDQAGFQNFLPKFQLMSFSLSYGTSEALNADVPTFLYNQYDLRTLDLSNNNFSGLFPSWLLENNTSLEALHLRQNSFVGPLELPNHPNPNLIIIDISNNNIHGQVPRNMCLVLPKLAVLRMAMNGLTGSIPSCFGNMSTVAVLDLSDNRLSKVKLEQLKRSWYVGLSNNNLGGQISPSIFNSSSLRYLYLDGNKFTGHVLDFQPTSGISLAALDISNNQFSGILPTWMGNFSNQMKAIDLSRNHFYGPLPRDFCKFDILEYLDMSENNLSGSIPSCFHPSSIKHVHLSKNQLGGPLTTAFYNSSSLVTLDIADNNLMGPISNWIGNLSVLSVLLLRGNLFAGELPTQLCLLEHLTILDVSRNQLSGPLPRCLGNFSLKENQEKAGGTGQEPFVLKSLKQLSNETGLLAGKINDAESNFEDIKIEETVQFTTKTNSYGYKGNILNYMTGFDLSSNNFSGEIPLEIIESLDLSHNKLDGVIPQQLTVLNNLAVFIVAYNNLSGETPERKYQFGTFDESSYEGNPFLCGPPLQKKCGEEESPSQPMHNDEREGDGFIDMNVFYVSFGVCYTIVVLTIAAVLCINPFWRRRWFHFIEDCIDTCYCFLLLACCVTGPNLCSLRTCQQMLVSVHLSGAL